MIKQLNIYGEVEYLNKDGTKNNCLMCSKNMTVKADFCSVKCSLKWLDKNYTIEEEIKKV